MRIDVVSIFPRYLDPLELSLTGKARDKDLLDLRVHDLRDWAHDRHHTVDDTPYGGGAGMVMKPEPWGAALDEVLPDGAVLVVPTPSGTVFTQAAARELAGHDHLVFACGRYEGIDQRFLDRHVTHELSLGDFVLSGGELPALVLLDAVARLQPGVLGDEQSHLQDSFGADGLLDCPHYSRPDVLPGERGGAAVPAVLLSGHHGAIARWRRERSLELTARRRGDLIALARARGLLNAADERFLASLGL